MAQNLRLEGLTLTVVNVKRSVAYYEKIGFKCDWNAAPHFALIGMGGPGGPSVGLLSLAEAKKEGVKKMTASQKLGIHVELSTDDLDGLYKKLKSKGIKFHTPPHDEPWERSASALDPDGYCVEFAQGRRGKK